MSPLDTLQLAHGTVLSDLDIEGQQHDADITILTAIFFRPSRDDQSWDYVLHLSVMPHDTTTVKARLPNVRGPFVMLQLLSDEEQARFRTLFSGQSVYEET